MQAKHRETKNDPTALAQVDFAGMVARRLAELHNLKLAVPARRAVNSFRGSRGSHRNPSHPVEDPLDPLHIEKVP